MGSKHSSAEADLFAELRALLLSREQERLAAIEQKINELDLREEQLRALLDELRRQHEDTTALIERITPSMTGMVRRTIRESGDEMAEILGPIMGDAIRVQIRDSREEMVDALYPIIGSTIQKAINQFAREFQRNIDQRLRSTFGPEGTLRRLWARLRGVRTSELVMREAFPFEVKQIFLVHRASGLLISHTNPQNANADIISGMLTAIRDFASDAFQGDDELDEIQFGNDRIVLRSGAHAYLAVVVSGIEPQGFHAQLDEFVSDLHLRYRNALRDFTGDPQDLPNLQPQLESLVATLNRRDEQPPLTSRQKWAYTLLTLTGILWTVLTCFYLIFTVRLFPVAFPELISAPTATPTFTPSATPTATPFPTFTSSPTFIPSPTFTASPTPQPPAALQGITSGTVWVRSQPDSSGNIVGLLLENTIVEVHAAQNGWLEVSWSDEAGEHRGWASAKWIRTEFPTPTP